MIWIALSVAYLVGYVASAAVTFRAFLEQPPFCHRYSTIKEPKRDCVRFHGEDCWRNEMTTTQMATAALGPLMWPLAAPPALAYWLASRPRRRVSTAARIAELEAELDMKEGR